MAAPVQRSAIAAFRQCFTLRQTRRIVPIMFSVGGRTLRPVSVRGDVHTFVVLAGVETIRLLSHATAPSEVAPWADDSRALGLSVRRIRVAEGAAVTDAAMDHPGLGAGWWAMENDAAGTRRWTSGDSRLPVGP